MIEVILQWLMQSIDSTRSHNINFYESWHARTMVFAWGFMIPLGILIARFFKVTPKQKFPQQTDNRFWWRCHLILQGLGGMMAIGSFVYILIFGGTRHMPLHETMGWIVIIGLGVQISLGAFRGTMGGPTDPASDDSLYGDHYYMTTRRYFFEYTHKSLGYVLLLLSWATGAVGMWAVNAPHWMWLILGAWLLFLVVAFVYLQRRGYAIDTYEALWGVEPHHPGNHKKITGLGVRRLRLEIEGKVPKKKTHFSLLTDEKKSEDTSRAWPTQYQDNSK